MIPNGCYEEHIQQVDEFHAIKDVRKRVRVQEFNIQLCSRAAQSAGYGALALNRSYDQLPDLIKVKWRGSEIVEWQNSKY